MTFLKGQEGGQPHGEALRLFPGHAGGACAASPLSQPTRRCRAAFTVSVGDGDPFSKPTPTSVLWSPVPDPEWKQLSMDIAQHCHPSR